MSWAGRWVAVLAALPVMAACGPRPASTSAPAAPASGAVNPDPGVAAYVCQGGEQLTVGYPDSQTAVVEYRGHAYTLKRARSGSGARYTGFGLQWWTKSLQRGTLSQLESGDEIAGGGGIACKAEAVTAPAPGAAGGERLDLHN